jgi:hypothetical protein
MQPTISREAVMFERRQPNFRWSAVLAGVACSVGLWMLLQILGTGIGLAAIDVDDAGSLRGVGIGTTVWSLITPLIAMFCGGLLTGRLTQTYERKLGGAHGLVMWAITSVLGLCVTIWMMTMLATGVARAGGAAAHAAGGALSQAADRIQPDDAMNALGVGADDMLGPINQRLTAQGKPSITAAQLRAATRGMARDAARNGNIDRDRLIDQLAANTQLSRADATDVANQIQARMNEVGSRTRDLGQRAEHAALNAADATGKALTTVGLALLLSLAAAVGGAMLAVRRPGRENTGGGSQRGLRRNEPGYVPPDETLGATTSAYPPSTTLPGTPVTPVAPRTDVTVP